MLTLGITKWILGLCLGILFFTVPATCFSLEVTDEAGRKVRLSTTPGRIVALAPSITECLFALGLNSEVVGVTEHTNFPPQATSRPKVGSYIHLQLEAIVALKPDLVLATRDGNPKEQIRRLEEMGLTVFVLDPRSLEGLFNTLLSLGEVLGRREEAGNLVFRLQQRIEGIKRNLGTRAKPRVLLQVGAQPLVVAGADTLQNHLIELAGGHNVAASLGRGYPMLSLESAMTLAPEVIIISSMADPRGAEQEKKRWNRWNTLPAVKSGRIHVIDGDLIDRPSPRIVEGLEELALIIHPEASGEVEKSK